jgi:ATP/ADP translocase/HEAT repeat protein
MDEDNLDSRNAPSLTSGLGILVSHFLETVLMVRPGEGRRTSLLFLQLLLSSSVFVLGRTVRDTLFLSRFPISALPWMFVCYGVASAITVVVYARFADRLSPSKAIVAWSVLGSLTYIGTWLAVQWELAWIYPVFYVWSEVFANLLISQFWTLANELHDSRSAKRLSGVVGSARVLGVIAVGAGTGAVVRLIGTAQLLFVLVAILLVVAKLSSMLADESDDGRSRRRYGNGERDYKPKIIGDSYVTALSLMILFAFTALTLGDYQFKAIARATYAEDDLARFFGFFYAVTGIVSFVFQILVTPRLLARFGVEAGASVMPALFGVSSGLLPFFPHLFVATVMKFSDNGFQYTIHETTLQALYVPFAASVRARTRVFLDAVVKPLSYGVGGGMLIALTSRLEVQQLSYVSFGLVGLWIATIPLVRKRYMSKLEDTLRTRGAVELESEENLEASSRKALIKALKSDEPRLVLAALRELNRDRFRDREQKRNEAMSAAVKRLVCDDDPSVRMAAVSLIDEGTPIPLETIASLLHDEHPDVRRAAIACFALLAGDDSAGVLAPLLDSPNPETRSAAMSALIAHGGLEGAIRGGARLETLLKSTNIEDRVEAAKVLGFLDRSAYRLLVRLLDDEQPEVRKAALRAATSVRDPRLVPRLIEELLNPLFSNEAGAALAAVGPTAIDPLVEALYRKDIPRQVVLVVPRLLRRIGSPKGYLALRRHLDLPDSRVRLRSYAAMDAMRRELNLPAEPMSFITQLLRLEIGETSCNLAAWREARRVFPDELFDRMISFRYRGAVRRVLRILALRYSSSTLRLVRHRMEDKYRRASALEVLDATLEPSLRPLVMPFVDRAEAEARAAATTFGRTVPPPKRFLLGECRHHNPYVAMLALATLSRKPDDDLIAMALQASQIGEPLVREGAITALSALPKPEAVQSLVRLSRDYDPIVAGIARHRLALIEGRTPEEVVMYSTLEKVLFLKRIPMFSDIHGDDLAPLARTARPLQMDTGQVVFREGDHGDELYVIVSGAVEVTRGNERLARMEAPEVFGELSVLDAGPRSATVTAIVPTDLLAIDSENMYETMHERTELAEGLIRMLASRLRAADERIPGAS